MHSSRAPRRSSALPALLSLLCAAGAASAALPACGPAMEARAEPEWPAQAKKWFDRAQASFAVLDIADADAALERALELAPDRDEVRWLAATVALSQLRYDDTVRLLEGDASARATGLRARAFWYSGQIARAREELDRLLDDPDVKDGWAQGVAQLARSGAGREPFRVTGALLAAVEMPRVPAPTLIVPLELNGDPVLAMVATGTPEVVIDSAQSPPSWVSLRFARRLEVKDVPALTRDLSSVSRRIGAPIKLLLGVNLLRRLNVTFDFYGSQFVVRSFEPPPPPSASVVELSYIKGGGMVLPTRLGAEAEGKPAALLVDTSELFPLALSESAWQKAGVPRAELEALPGEAGLKQGSIPRMTLGSFDLPRVPALFGLPIDRLEQGGGIEVDGVIGSALMSEFRVSLANEGRTMWLEELPAPMPGPAPVEGESSEAPVSSRGG